MNEINALIWPSPAGIGLLDKALYDQTISIATTYKVLKAAPAAEATRTDLAEKALAALGSSVDTKGASLYQGHGHAQGGRQLGRIHPRQRQEAGPRGPASSIPGRFPGPSRSLPTPIIPPTLNQRASGP